MSESHTPLCDCCGNTIALQKPPFAFGIRWGAVRLPGGPPPIAPSVALTALERGVRTGEDGRVGYGVDLCYSCATERVGLDPLKLAQALAGVLVPATPPAQPPAPPTSDDVVSAALAPQPRIQVVTRPVRRRHAKEIAKAVAKDAARRPVALAPPEKGA